MSKSRRTSDLVNAVFVNPDNSVNIHEGTQSPYFLLDTGAVVTPQQGMMFWDADRQTVGVQMNGVEARLGQDNFWYVKNQTGSTIPKGKAVMAVGTLGASGRILIDEMVADGSVSPKYLLGITAESIANGADGFVMNIGKIRQLDTSAWPDGTVLYCDASTPGNLTATAPSSPNLALPVAFVVHSAANGIIAVRIQTLDENAFATPTLDQVTTAGNTTTNAITVGATQYKYSGHVIGEIRGNANTYNNFDLVYGASWNGSQWIDQLGAYGSNKLTLGNDGIVFYTGSNQAGGFPVNYTERMRMANTGNVLIGTTTDAGYKLDVNGTTRLNGLTSINSTTVANTALAIGANGTGAGNFIIQGYDASANNRFYLTASGNFRINGQTDNGASGTDEKFKLNLSFAPTSGTREHFGLWLQQTINQTGGANGITRGLYVNPTLTSAADFRAIETSAGKVIHQGLTAATQTNQVYYDSATGELTYGALPVVATPTLDAVTTAGNTTTNAITVGGLNVDSGTLYVNPVNNRVGIGTTTPADALDLSAAGGIRAYSNLRFVAPGVIHNTNTGGGTGLVIIGSGGSPNNFLELRATSSPYSTTDFVKITTGANGAQEVVRFLASGNTLFGTTTDSGYKLDVNGTLRITNDAYFATTSGNLGIGTTTPSEKLEVAGDIAIRDTIGALNFIYSSTPTRIARLDSDNGNLRIKADINGAQASSFISFDIDNSEKSRINSNGNVLIGTTTDAGYKLDVNGTIRSNNTITASGGNSTEWNTAYSWGDHSTQGYITGTTGFTGTFTVPTNPPGQQNLDIQNGLIINVF